MSTFRALVVDKQEEAFDLAIRELNLADLPDGEVLIKVAYSSVNFKDGLASIPNGQIVRNYPLIPGIDLAGTVVESKVGQFREGDEVIVTSYELGVSHHGGYSEYARVPAKWVVPLPEGLTLKEAMALGTAGFTAALSIRRLEENGLQADQGEVLVTGATGGVGSNAVAILAKQKYQVVASTGKEAEHAYLRQLGAGKILSREEIAKLGERALEKELWAGAIDPVGGKSLAYLLKTMKRGASVAVSGLTGGSELNTTVFPFILRGVNLLGIDSVYCPMKLRRELWEKLSNEWKPDFLLESIAHEVSLNELPQTLSSILKGHIRGRTIVRL